MMFEIVILLVSNVIDVIYYLYSINIVLCMVFVLGELLWLLLMLLILFCDCLQVLIVKVGLEKEKYFQEWFKCYLIFEGILFGVYINLSINLGLVKVVFESFFDCFKDEVVICNYLYQIIIQGFVCYCWLLIYLFGVSLIVE